MHIRTFGVVVLFLFIGSRHATSATQGDGFSIEADLNANAFAGSTIPVQVTMRFLNMSNASVRVGMYTADPTCTTVQNVSWLSFAQLVQVPPQGEQDISVSFDASGLSVGNHTATFCAETDDVLGTVAFPVEFAITPYLPLLQPAIVSAGLSFSCAIVANGGVECWGNDVVSPGSVAGLNNTAAVVSGVAHSCAIVADKTVHCWGSNTQGQLGNGMTGGQSSTPVTVLGVTGALDVAAGGEQSCALVAGTVKCWGGNSSGELGNGTTTNSATAVNVAGLPTAYAIAAKEVHTCALVSAGAVYCWGGNGAGELGDGTQTQRSSPVQVIGLSGPAVAIVAGGSHTCAIIEGGGVQCWGLNNRMQLGSTTPIISPTPLTVSGLAGPAVALAAGMYHTCAVLQGGSVQCWGDDSDFQLGSQLEYSTSAAPVNVVGLTDVFAIAADESHTCVSTAISGEVLCWGDNQYGQIGNGQIGGAVQIPSIVSGASTLPDVILRNGFE